MPLANAKGVVPLTTYVLISNFKVRYHLLRRADGSFDRQNDETLDHRVPSSLAPVDGVSSLDITIDPVTGLWCRLFWSYSARAGEGKPALIFFHGGSFAHSSADSAIYDMMCRRLCHLCHVVVLSVNFRRAPEHKYPAAYEDGLTALRWARSQVGGAHLAVLGCGSPAKCILIGDSSGGNIAHHVAVRASLANIAVAGMIQLMPMYGGLHRTAAECLLDGKYFVTVNDRDWYWRAFLPVGATRDHPACDPFSRVLDEYPSMADIHLPPCLVVVGGLDLLHDWQLNYVHGLKQAGHHVQLLFLEKATMGFFLLPNSNFFYTLVETILHFLATLH